MSKVLLIFDSLKNLGVDIKLTKQGQNAVNGDRVKNDGNCGAFNQRKHNSHGSTYSPPKFYEIFYKDKILKIGLNQAKQILEKLKKSQL
jgi:hypothetical protein